MLYIRRNEYNPWFNLAAEEYVLKQFSEEVIMLWQSRPAVVVGKHQNTVAEVNIPYAYKENIPVIRRISGGGTVFHGPGNLNFTHIHTGKNQSGLVDFKAFAKPVVAFLKHYGVTAKPEGKNNLCVAGKKFSGNAAHVFKNRIIHHGTLLFDTDLTQLEQVIAPSKADIKDKSIASVRASVGNLKTYLPEFPDFKSFKDRFEAFLLTYFAVDTVREFTHKEREEIETLVREKYETIPWNFGYSPNYRFNKELKTEHGEMHVEMKVTKGIISDIRLFYEGKRLTTIEDKLKGKGHDPVTIHQELSSNRLAKRVIDLLF